MSQITQLALTNKNSLLTDVTPSVWFAFYGKAGMEQKPAVGLHFPKVNGETACTLWGRAVLPFEVDHEAEPPLIDHLEIADDVLLHYAGHRLPPKSAFHILCRDMSGVMHQEPADSSAPAGTERETIILAVNLAYSSKIMGYGDQIPSFNRPYTEDENFPARYTNIPKAYAKCQGDRLHSQFEYLATVVAGIRQMGDPNPFISSYTASPFRLTTKDHGEVVITQGFVYALQKLCTLTQTPCRTLVSEDHMKMAQSAMIARRNEL